MKTFITTLSVLTFSLGWMTSAFAEETTPVDYARQIQPLLTKYCSGCHNDAEPEGEFSTETYQSLHTGLEGRPVILEGDPQGSLLLRLLEGRSEPVMPPEDEPAPTEAEIDLIRQWVEQGAHAPQGVPMSRLELNVPQLTPNLERKPITALACSPQGLVAVGQFGQVSLIRSSSAFDDSIKAISLSEPVFKLDDLPGKVNSLDFSNDGTKLVVAAGVAGRGGWIGFYEVATGKLLKEFEGHRDTIYHADLNPAGDTIASCSYDRSIILWNAETGKPYATMDSHNGAVYDVNFSPDGQQLISASADDTCKIWRTSDGERLDTLGQPLKECYACAFSPDGSVLSTVGADKKLRIWKMVSRKSPRINPQLFARFAHEEVVSGLLWTPDSSDILTFAEDGVIKLWDAQEVQERFVWDSSDQSVHGAVAMSADGKSFFVGRMDGTLQQYLIPGGSLGADSSEGTKKITFKIPKSSESAHSKTEQEPNQSPEQASLITIPAEIQGTISGRNEGRADYDLYRFAASEGEQWVIEVNAARSKSPLDSFVEVLDSQGNKILRTQLQAVRESYFTFRGKTSDQVNDFRIFNWTEMKLNEYLYANGEVTRFFHYPRGADSGFNVYPAQGKRWGYFDTTPLAHALGEPCYVVRPLGPDEEIIPNGLPVFPIYFENDDCSMRELVADSRLYFTAPENGEYLVKIYDVRGYEGPDYNYKLTIRPSAPSYKASLKTPKLTIHPGSRDEFRVGIKRIDRFEGPVTFHISSDVPGLRFTSPVVVEAEHIEAMGVVEWEEGTELPEDLLKHIKIEATAEVLGETVKQSVGGFTELKQGGKPKVAVRIGPSENGPQSLPAGEDGLLVFQIHPGETIPLKVFVDRFGTEQLIQFGKEESGRNLPFGVFVDNIGLNGLMITEGDTEREFFITCDPVAVPQKRLFHLRTGALEGHATQPVWIEVLEK